MKFRTPTIFWLFCAVWLVFAPSCAQRTAGAGAQNTAQVLSIEGSQTRITAEIADDPEIEALIQPYRDSFQARMAEVLATTPQQLRTGRPEGPLGSLVADITLDRARAETGLPVKVAIANNGGLRIALEPGEITLGEIFELMPFDNEIVAVRLTAAEADSLANQIAAIGGEPIAGMSFVIQGARASDIRVAGQPLGTEDVWVATSDYLAAGGGQMPALWSPQESIATGILVRDAIADALRAAKTVSIPAAGRITER